MAFKIAQRKNNFLKLTITGPTGSGKTFSALQLAFGIAGKDGIVGVVDTENGSASLYESDFPPYYVEDIAPPYAPSKLIKAIDEAIENNITVLIVDSGTHFWAGSGGILDRKTDIDLRGGGNSYTNWGIAGKEYEEFKDKLMQAPIHIIFCMRSKMEHVMEKGNDGRTVVRTVGLAPVMRDGMEYEFTMQFDIDKAHNAKVVKNRTHLFGDDLFVVTKEHGEIIKKWRDSGAKMIPTEASLQKQLEVDREKFNAYFIGKINDLDSDSFSDEDKKEIRVLIRNNWVSDINIKSRKPSDMSRDQLDAAVSGFDLLLANVLLNKTEKDVVAEQTPDLNPGTSDNS